MKRQLFFSKTSRPSSQRGIATILIVVLIGVALTATAIGMMHSIRSTQEKHIAVHAVTNAQTGAWAGVEAFRRYLDSKGVEGLTAGVYPIELTGYGTMQAKVQSVNPTGTGGYRIEATIVNVQDAAHASAAVGVIYEVTPSYGEYELSGPLNFNDDLELTSRLVLDKPLTINVKGDVKIANANISNLQGINATGSVTVVSNNAVQLGTIHANGDVKLSGTDATATEIKAQGKVTLQNTAKAPLISANGDVFHNASTNTMSMRSRSDITVDNSGNHDFVSAGGGVTINSTYKGTITDLWSVRTIINKSKNATLVTASGEATFDCENKEWNGFTKIAVNGTIDSACTKLLPPLEPGQTVIQNAGVKVDVMNPVSSFTMPTLAVDVYPFRAEANYVVSYVEGKIKVRVSNINGLEDGIYYVANGHKICRELKSNGDCNDDTPTDKYVCLGQSPSEACLTYSFKSFTVAENASASISYQDLTTGTHPSKGYFEVQGAGIAPGIWWFDGSLIFSNGYNNGTILATGNIATSNHYRGAAVNYGAEPVIYSDSVRDETKRTTPYEEICEVIGTGLNNNEMGHHLATYKNRFKDQFPTNLCNKTDGVYIPHKLGNIALAAGGVRPSDNELGGDDITYSGGDIYIKNNSNIFGIVLAGGYLSVRNNVAITGYVSASVQGPARTDGAVKNITDGDIKIYTDSETEWYSPKTVPWMGADPCQVGCGTPLPGSGAKLLWSRYL
ncbi:hypothetical protein DWB84_10935 [Saccharophagus sp. K07]|uniref:hypothetical protein n=1 Tax=Saccharophagus sp. K07 TaxID=2283636 RepID=UPI0016520C77|nr:hypothetical protein [Saccharophagus sp. K07]MBC6905972.1 hypothetical protein [Saccharophagus sp. K07]